MITLDPIEMKALCASKLFAGYSAIALAVLLDELGAAKRTFANGETLILEGDPVDWMGIVLSGGVHVCALDLSAAGGLRIQNLLGEGGVVCASMIGSARTGHPATLVGHGKGALAAFSLAKVRSLQKAGKEIRFFTNLSHYLSEQLIASWRKCAILSCANIAERVMLYLRSRAQDEGTDEVTIPSTEEAFANYLGVNRAALSRTLGKLKREGKIAYRKNVFRISEK